MVQFCDEKDLSRHLTKSAYRRDEDVGPDIGKIRKSWLIIPLEKST